MDKKEQQALENYAREIRIGTIEAIASLGAGHLGGSLSVAELLAMLYFRWMTIDPKNPQLAERDRMVMSKGHAGPGVYATLALKGYFPWDWLLTLNKGGTRLPSHCDMNRTPGIDFTTGSLGQGSSAAVGIALGMRLKKLKSFCYLVLGDGESQEGQVWEAALSAAHYKLGHLIAFTDYNKKQLDGWTKKVMNMDDINAKWLGFGWHVQRVNGHDVQALDEAVIAAKEVKERPSMIIMDTIKSMGYPAGVDIVLNHSLPVPQDEAQKAIKKLREDIAHAS